MKGVLKRLFSVVVVAVATLTLGISVSAEKADYQLDTSKARKTNGGGQAFTYYLRNTNEVRKHGKHMDNAWLTEDSEIQINWEYMGEVPEEKKAKGIDYPGTLVLQCWSGDKVTATEQRWVELVPTTWSEDNATFTYADMLKQWGKEDLSEVYALVVIDEGTSLTVHDIVVTNLDIPEGVEYEGLTLINDEAVITTESVEAETSISEDSAETVETSEGAVSETVKESEVTQTDNKQDNTADKSDANNMTIVIIIGAVVAAVVVAVIIIIVAKKKPKKKGNYYD